MTLAVIAETVERERSAGECGTWAAYGAGCRCSECQDAAARYIAQWRREPPARVPVGQVQKRIVELMEAGYSQEEIAQRSGVSQATLSRIVNGRVKRCSIETRRAILGMALEPSTNNISVVLDEDVPPPDTDPLAGLIGALRGLDLSWKADAACARLVMRVQRRQDWFFPNRGDQLAKAIAVCARCPVWRECLGFALATCETEGVWGRAAASHRRKIAHHEITVDELGAAGMDDDPDLSITEAIERVLAARAEAV